MDKVFDPKTYLNSEELEKRYQCSAETCTLVLQAKDMVVYPMHVAVTPSNGDGRKVKTSLTPYCSFGCMYKSEPGDDV